MWNNNVFAFCIENITEIFCCPPNRLTLKTLILISQLTHFHKIIEFHFIIHVLTFYCNSKTITSTKAKIIRCV